MTGILALRLGGASPPLADIVDGSATDSQPFDLQAAASYSFGNDGLAGGDPNGEPFPNYTWLLSGSASDFDIKAIHSGSALAAGSDATGSWLSLGTTRTWGLFIPSGNTETKVATLTIQISLAGLATVIDTATVVITAEVTP